jgi:plasmid stabilization system protein ParE
MTLVRILPRAEQDAAHIFAYISEHSPDGAIRWWEAFECAIAALGSSNSEAYSIAPENDLTDLTLRQFLFKTRRGKTYRGIFTVVGAEIRVLRVRGPGQAPVDPEDLT